MTISPSITQRGGQLGLDRRDQFGEIAGHRPLVAAAQLDLVARRENRWTGSRPTWAHRTRPAGSCLTDLASIGETGGMTGKSIGAIVACGMLESRYGCCSRRTRRRRHRGPGDQPGQGVFPRARVERHQGPARRVLPRRGGRPDARPRCGTGPRICSASRTASTARRSTRSGCRSTIPTICRPAG